VFICKLFYPGAKMRVRIVTQSTVLSQAMRHLVTSFGFKVSGTTLWGDGSWGDKGADVIVYDCTRQGVPYPAPSRLPTLALISGNSEEGQKLLEQGYVGYLTPEADGNAFKKLLESVRRNK
jgi:hypothetical protein